ncbi:MAG: phasin family protein [Pseudomonadota bacterium]
MSTKDPLRAQQKAELEAAFALSQTLFRGFEQTTQLQLQMMRDMSQHTAAAVEAALSARDLQQAWNAQAQAAPKTGGEEMLTYFQKLAQIISATQAEMVQTMNSRLSRMQAEIQETAQQGASGLPVNVEPVQALFQSATTFANQAIEAVQNAQQQALKLMSEQAKGLSPTAQKTTVARKRGS